MEHRNFKPRKTGLFDQRITDQKLAAVQATVSSTALKGAVMCMLYGSAIVEVPERSILLQRLWLPTEAPGAHSFSDQGDFTGVYRGGFY